MLKLQRHMTIVKGIMPTRLIGLIIFMLAIGVIYLTYDQFSEEVNWIASTPSQRLSIIVQNDFKNLAKSNLLPPEWGQIQNVTYKMNSSVTKALMGDQKPDLHSAVPKSKKTAADLIYEAEVEVIDIPDEKNPGFILQISLLNLKTKNKVFEIGRSYYFSSLNKKKPD